MNLSLKLNSSISFSFDINEYCKFLRTNYLNANLVLIYLNKTFLIFAFFLFQVSERKQISKIYFSKFIEETKIEKNFTLVFGILRAYVFICGQIVKFLR